MALRINSSFEWRDYGLNGQAVARRRFDQGLSRRPTSDMCRVRGMGVAERASASTFLRISFKRSLLATPKRLFLVDDHQAEILEAHIFGEQADVCQ